MPKVNLHLAIDVNPPDNVCLVTPESTVWWAWKELVLKIRSKDWGLTGYNPVVGVGIQNDYYYLVMLYDVPILVTDEPEAALGLVRHEAQENPDDLDDLMVVRMKQGQYMDINAVRDVVWTAYQADPTKLLEVPHAA